MTDAWKNELVAFGRRLQSLRKASGLTQQGLANRIPSNTSTELPVEQARAHPSRLLQPRLTVVPFTGRDDALGEADTWRGSTKAVAVQLDRGGERARDRPVRHRAHHDRSLPRGGAWAGTRCAGGTRGERPPLPAPVDRGDQPAADDRPRAPARGWPRGSHPADRTGPASTPPCRDGGGPAHANRGTCHLDVAATAVAQRLAEHRLGTETDTARRADLHGNLLL